jgi:hypothetical protein
LTGKGLGLGGLLEVVRCEQAAIRNPGATVCEVDDATNPRLQALTDFV